MRKPVLTYHPYKYFLIVILEQASQCRIKQHLENNGLKMFMDLWIKKHLVQTPVTKEEDSTSKNPSGKEGIPAFALKKRWWVMLIREPLRRIQIVIHHADNLSREAFLEKPFWGTYFIMW